MSKKPINIHAAFNKKDIRYNRAVVVALMLIVLNVGLYFAKTSPAISGFVVGENTEIPLDDPEILSISEILLIATLVILVVFVIFMYMRHLKHKKKAESVHINQGELQKMRERKTGTDIDVLYNLLQKREEIPLSVVVNIFRINKDKALKWSKILEDHNLATVNYPAFSEPVLLRKK